MKKIVILSLLAVLMLTACGKKADSVIPSSAPEYTGVYRHTWSEEIAGTVLNLNAYIVLNADHTGYWIAQDVGTLTWDNRQLTLTVGETLDIALSQENSTTNLLVYQFQDDYGVWTPTVFEKIERLPAEIESQFLPIL